MLNMCIVAYNWTEYSTLAVELLKDEENQLPASRIDSSLQAELVDCALSLALRSRSGPWLSIVSNLLIAWEAQIRTSPRTAALSH